MLVSCAKSAGIGVGLNIKFAARGTVEQLSRRAGEQESRRAGETANGLRGRQSSARFGELADPDIAAGHVGHQFQLAAKRMDQALQRADLHVLLRLEF